MYLNNINTNNHLEDPDNGNICCIYSIIELSGITWPAITFIAVCDMTPEFPVFFLWTASHLYDISEILSIYFLSEEEINGNEWKMTVIPETVAYSES